MKKTKSSLVKWKCLYKAAEAFRDSKPWEYFDDSFIFGIQDPISNENGWCVIMGANGQVFGLMVYTGDEGLLSYEDIVLSLDEENDMSMAFNQKGLRVEFVNKNEVSKEDFKTFNDLDLKYRGKKQYVVIRRIDPGLFPWYLDESQVDFLTICLQQSINIIEQAKDGEVEITDYECGELLLYVPENINEKIEWKPTYIEFPEFDEQDKYLPNTFILNRLRRELKKKESLLFFSFQFINKPLQHSQDQRPYIPRLAFWVDGKSGLIIDFIILHSNKFWNDFQVKFVDILHDLEYIPTTMAVDSSMGMEVMDMYCDKLGIDLVYAADHPLYEKVKDSMKDFY